MVWDGSSRECSNEVMFSNICKYMLFIWHATKCNDFLMSLPKMLVFSKVYKTHTCWKGRVWQNDIPTHFQHVSFVFVIFMRKDDLKSFEGGGGSSEEVYIMYTCWNVHSYVKGKVIKMPLSWCIYPIQYVTPWVNGWRVSRNILTLQCSAKTYKVSS